MKGVNDSRRLHGRRWGGLDALGRQTTTAYYENISPAAAVALAADGVDAWHVRDRGLESTTDRELPERAYQEDRILVTLNVGDFEKLVHERELHAGVVLIELAGLLRDEQIELIKSVAVALAMTFDKLAHKT